MSEKKEIVTKMKPPQFVLERQPNVPTEEEELAKESKVEARVKELAEGYSRRQLEALARSLDIEPSKREYPNKDSLARAIAEKELPEEEPEVVVETEHVAEGEVEE